MKKIVIPLMLSVAVFMSLRVLIPGPETVIHAFFAGYGFELSDELIEIEEISLPDKLTPVYENYNRLQLQAGLNIMPYLGKTVKRYTYTVLNFPFETSSPVRANALVYKNKVIASDLMTVDIDGFMLSPADPVFRK